MVTNETAGRGKTLPEEADPKARALKFYIKVSH